MSKHTPGPWRLDRARVLIPLDEHTWAEAYGGTEANARLIAASPRLFDLLKAAYEDPDSDILGEKWNAAVCQVLNHIELGEWL